MLHIYLYTSLFTDVSKYQSLFEKTLNFKDFVTKYCRNSLYDSSILFLNAPYGLLYKINENVFNKKKLCLEKSTRKILKNVYVKIGCTYHIIICANE